MAIKSGVSQVLQCMQGYSQQGTVSSVPLQKLNVTWSTHTCVRGGGGGGGGGGAHGMMFTCMLAS